MGLAERSTIPIKIVSVQLHAGNASVACGVIVIISAFLNCFFAVGRSGKFLEVYASIQVIVWVLTILVFAVLIDVDLEQRIHQALQEQVDTFDDSGGGVEPGPTEFPTDINRIQHEVKEFGS